MRSFFGLFPIRTWLILAFIVIVVIALLSVRAACTAADRARKDANQAASTGKALDKVAAETPVIRQEQEEKQREVDNLQGADQPLPAGFGRDLERVRRGRSEDNHSR